MIFTCMYLFPIFRWYLECLGAKDQLDSMKWVRDLYLLAPAVHGNRVTWSNSRKGSLQAEFFNDSDGSRWYKKLRHRFRVAARWIWRRCQSYRRRCKNVSYKVLNFFLSCWWWWIFMLQGAQADSDDREARLPIDAYCVRDCTWICHGLPCPVLPAKHCFEF